MAEEEEVDAGSWHGVANSHVGIGYVNGGPFWQSGVKVGGLCSTFITPSLPAEASHAAAVGLNAAGGGGGGGAGGGGGGGAAAACGAAAAADSAADAAATAACRR